MKKVVILLCFVAVAISGIAQTIPDPGMETWRSNTSGGTVPIPVTAPYAWNGIDSLIISDGQAYGPFIGVDSPDVWVRQLFEENVIVHSGLHSAKMITLKQDTLGIFPGTLTNATVSIAVRAIILGASPASATSFTGGLPDTQKVTSVSAWVVYKSGKDSAGIRNDSGSLTIQAITNYHGYDSVVGTGFVLIPPTDTFMQITAYMVYVDTVDLMDTLRITFASSDGTNNNDSSTLYVDDVTTAGVPQPPSLSIRNNNIAGNAISVYPNPASDKLFIDGIQNQLLTCNIYAVNGMLMMKQQVSGKTETNIASLPEGLYFYTIGDEQNNIIQRGKISIVR